MGQTKIMLVTQRYDRAQELCESRDGRPGLPSLISLWFVWTAVETATAQCTSRCAMARGHRFNTSTDCSGGGPRSLRSFSGGIRGRAFTLSSPPTPTPPSPSLISNLASVDVKRHGQGHGRKATLNQIAVRVARTSPKNSFTHYMYKHTDRDGRGGGGGWGGGGA